jgi:hypothetical protein
MRRLTVAPLLAGAATGVARRARPAARGRFARPAPGTRLCERPSRQEAEAVLLSSSLDHGVLVLTVHQDPGADGRDLLLATISDLVRAHRPAPVVIVLDEPATVGAAVGVVLRVHRLCNSLRVLMSVATGSAPTRRLLEANADTSGTRLVIHARTDTAISAAFAATA